LDIQKRYDLPDTGKTVRRNGRYNDPGKPTESQLICVRNISGHLSLCSNLSLPCSLPFSPALIPLAFLPEGNGKDVRPECSAATSLQTFHKRHDLVVLDAKVEDMLLSQYRG
jgi:hypothetical protein